MVTRGGESTVINARLALRESSLRVEDGPKEVLDDGLFGRLQSWRCGLKALSFAVDGL